MTAIALFSYGTLRDPAVQRALFGRSIDGVPDLLEGFRLDRVRIADPEAIATSGAEIHLILRRGTGDPIAGVRLALTPDELAIADDYEGPTYARIEVRLGSGERAFVYVAPS